MYLYIHIYIYIHIHIHVYIYIYTYVYVYVCVHVCIYTYIYIHMCVCIYLYIYIYVPGHFFYMRFFICEHAFFLHAWGYVFFTCVRPCFFYMREAMFFVIFAFFLPPSWLLPPFSGTPGSDWSVAKVHGMIDIKILARKS